MTEFTLDCFLESGNAYKAALMLELSGADWEPRRVAFFSGRHVRRNSAN
jgi:glutathione S-transferase